MKNRRLIIIVLGGAGVVLIGLIIWLIVLRSGPPVEKEPYLETFEATGTWTAGEGIDAQGQVVDGAYEMSVDLIGDIYWATAGRVFADGVYEVEATPLDGTINNGYGLLFRVDEEEESFYIFKVSSDGYVFVGQCINNCAEQAELLDQDWFPSPSVRQGLDVTNQLRVVASGGNMTFYVNNELVGEASDDNLIKGDIGLVAETFAPGGSVIAFDNFRVTPLEP